MQAVLILEDNNHKICRILDRYDEFLKHQDVLIARSSEAAKAFVESDPGLMTLFIDFELAPGCGDGVEFLMWALHHHPAFIEKVVITSLSPTAANEMAKLCRNVGIPHERL